MTIWSQTNTPCDYIYPLSQHPVNKIMLLSGCLELWPSVHEQIHPTARFTQFNHRVSVLNARLLQVNKNYRVCWKYGHGHKQIPLDCSYVLDLRERKYNVLIWVTKTYYIELYLFGYKELREYIYLISIFPRFWVTRKTTLVGEIYIQLSRGGETICPTGPIMVRRAEAEKCNNKTKVNYGDLKKNHVWNPDLHGDHETHWTHNGQKSWSGKM